MICLKFWYNQIITDNCRTNYHANVRLQNILAKMLLVKIYSCSISLILTRDQNWIKSRITAWLFVYFDRFSSLSLTRYMRKSCFILFFLFVLSFSLSCVCDEWEQNYFLEAIFIFILELLEFEIHIVIDQIVLKIIVLYDNKLKLVALKDVAIMLFNTVLNSRFRFKTKHSYKHLFSLYKECIAMFRSCLSLSSSFEENRFFCFVQNERVCWSNS